MLSLSVDPGLGHIKGLGQLEHLVLWNCLRLSEAGLTVLSSLTKLTHLSLRGCQQLSDTALHHVAALNTLQHLNLTACERMSGMAYASPSVRLCCSTCRVCAKHVR